MTRRSRSRTCTDQPAFRLVCCLCGCPIPLASEVYALDAEWRRRFPQMMGVLACVQCAVLSHDWVCLTPDGEYVVGHLQAAGRSQEQDFDSWGHIETHGSHLAMARRYPWSALQQGAEDYLRWLAHRPTASRVIAQASKDLQDTLYRWDRRDPRDDVPDGSAPN